MEGGGAKKKGDAAREEQQHTFVSKGTCPLQDQQTPYWLLQIHRKAAYQILFRTLAAAINQKGTKKPKACSQSKNLNPIEL